MTDAEQAIWRVIRNRQISGLKFRRQHPFHDYILDFVCLEILLVIEIDGGQHNLQKEYDEERSVKLRSSGFHVLRFWNNEVLQNIEAVKEKIWMTIQELQNKHQHLPHPHPNPPLEGEGIKNKKIAVAMSGGVDSSVTAALLKQQGYEVFGITMQLFEPRKQGAGTPAYDAALVAEHLGIEHHLFDFSPDFSDLIIDDFVNEYRCGHTPNPCVRCNRFVKFGLLLDKARELGADLLATGHYVRKTVDPNGTRHLRVARNFRKDQSYFLYTLTQERLSRVLFPLGEIESKDEVRRLAHEFGIPVAEKSDSQEVCFIPDDDYVAFLEQSNSLNPAGGEIVHVSGKVVGKHKGTHRYTIGQRKGLGIAWKKPLFVTAIDTQNNRIIVGEEQHVYADGLLAEQVSWIIQPSERAFATTCKIRYRHQPVPCQVELLEGEQCRVIFAAPQKSVTPGQSVVFYKADEVLGGGLIISKSV